MWSDKAPDLRPDQRQSCAIEPGVQGGGRGFKGVVHLSGTVFSDGRRRVTMGTRRARGHLTATYLVGCAVQRLHCLELQFARPAIGSLRQVSARSVPLMPNSTLIGVSIGRRCFYDAV